MCARSLPSGNAIDSKDLNRIAQIVGMDRISGPLAPKTRRLNLVLAPFLEQHAFCTHFVDKNVHN